jgi:hypothetical protein
MTRFKYRKKQVIFPTCLDYIPVHSGILVISDTRTNIIKSFHALSFLKFPYAAQHQVKSCQEEASEYEECN